MITQDWHVRKPTVGQPSLAAGQVARAQPAYAISVALSDCLIIASRMHTLSWKRTNISFAVTYTVMALASLFSSQQ